MDTGTALAAIKFVIQNAEDEGVTPHFDFFGGEPLLRWDEVIVPCVQYIRNVYKKPCELGITTNCLLLDEDKLRFLSENNVGMLVSMDGARETHDLNRPFAGGGGSFDAVVEKAQLILKHYPNISVRMTLTPETAGRLHEDVQFLQSVGFKQVECVPNVFVTWPDDVMAQLHTQLRQLSDDYLEHYPAKGFHEFERTFRNVKKMNYAYQNDLHRVNGCLRCGIGLDNQSAINYLGDIYPCHEANYDAALCIGNVFTGMDDAKRRSLGCSYSQRKVRGLNCETCRYDNVCNGGCAIFNYMINRDFNIVPQMTCAWKQMMIDEAEYILSRMADLGNTVFRDYFRGL